MFQTKFSKQAEKFLSRCEDELFRRIKKKANNLETNPVPSDAKRMQGYKKLTFRIRIGKYRVLYEIKESENLIVVVKIDKREKIYN